MRRLALAACALVLAGAAAPSASAAPPPNDSPAAAGAFEPYTARFGAPADLQAVAEPAEATPDLGVTPCLGSSSFARTVWYRIAASAGARQLTVEASGRTLAPIDLAAFVQPAVVKAPLTRIANACAGEGAGGAAAAEDSVTAVSLRVPRGRSVLVQVGRRGPVGPPEDEQIVLALTETSTEPTTPKGDRASRATPAVPRSGTAIVGLSGATTTEEDPAIPRCPSQATVWRRVRPAAAGRFRVTATGTHAGSLTVFRGARPTRKGFVDCVDREGRGPLMVPVRARKRELLWVRVGTDRPPVGARGRIAVGAGRRGDVADGGACLASTRRPRISGALSAGSPLARLRNRTRYVGVLVRSSRAPACGVTLEIVGANGLVYASGRVAAVLPSPRVVYLRRTRRLVPGRYRVRAEVAGLAGVRTPAPSTVSFRLR